MKTNDINQSLNKTISLKPYVYKKPSISAVSIRMLILLSLQILMLFFTKTYSSLIIIGISILAGFLASYIHYLLTKQQYFSCLSSIIQGILIGMFLPQTYPPITAFFITLITLLIYKYIFEDSENFWLNIVCISVIIAYFVGQNYFPEFLISSELYSAKNPSISLIQNGVFPIYDFDSSFTNYLNSTLFSSLKVTLPEGILSMLWDTQSVIPAFRFNLLTIIASIVLFSDNSFSSLIPTIFIFVYALLVRLFFPLLCGGSFNQGDITLAILTSGTLFIAVFLIQWFGTHPMTVVGKIVYSTFAGIFAFAIVGCGTSPIGMIYVVIICNILNLLIRYVEERKNDKFFDKIVAAGIHKDTE